MRRNKNILKNKKYNIRKEDFGIVKEFLLFLNYIGFKKTIDGYVLEKYIIKLDNYTQITFFKIEDTNTKIQMFELEWNIMLHSCDFAEYLISDNPDEVLRNVLNNFKNGIKEEMKSYIRKKTINNLIK